MSELQQKLTTKSEPKIKLIKAYKRQGLQCGDSFIRPDANLVVTPADKQQEDYVKELIKQGVLYEVVVE